MSRPTNTRPSSISSKSSGSQGKVLSTNTSQMAVPPPPPVYVRRAKPGEIKTQPKPKDQPEAKAQPKYEKKILAVEKYREDVRKSHNRQSRLHAYIAEDGEVEDDAMRLLEAVAPLPRPRLYSTVSSSYSRDSVASFATMDKAPKGSPNSSTVRLGNFAGAEEDDPRGSRCCVDFKAWFKCLCNPFIRTPKPTPNILLAQNHYSSVNLPLFLEPTLHDNDFRVKVHVASRSNSSSSLETIA